jgi:hypothetical protein
MILDVFRIISTGWKNSPKAEIKCQHHRAEEWVWQQELMILKNLWKVESKLVDWAMDDPRV